MRLSNLWSVVERVEMTSADLLDRVRVVKMEAKASAVMGLGKLFGSDMGRYRGKKSEALISARKNSLIQRD